MSLFNLFKLHFLHDFEVQKGLEILGLGEIEDDRDIVLNEISLYLFGNSQVASSKKVFDYELDYKYYYTDFLEFGIDLNTKNISWWEFNAILDGIFLKENSRIGKVIQYRTYKKPSKSSKSAEQEEHKFYLDKQKQYALPLEENKQNVDNGLNSLFNFVASRTGKE